MRILSALFVLVATPAAAHHEVVVATSLLPLMGGLATIAVAAITAFRKALRKRLQRVKQPVSDAPNTAPISGL